MVSVVITSYKEPKTIGRTIRSIADLRYSGLPSAPEIIQVSPDQKTLTAGKREAQRLRLGKRFIQIKDAREGKSTALNLALKQVRGEIIILTDGDVYFDKNAAGLLIKPFPTLRLVQSLDNQYQIIPKAHLWDILRIFLPMLPTLKGGLYFQKKKMDTSKENQTNSC